MSNEVQFPITVEFTLHEFLKMRRTLEQTMTICNWNRSDAAEMWMKMLTAAGLHPVDPRPEWAQEREKFIKRYDRCRESSGILEASLE